MTEREKTRGVLTPLALIGFIYLLSIRKYKLPKISFFVPNTSLFSKNENKSDTDTKRKILSLIGIKFVTKPKTGWLFYVKPVKGIKVNVSLLMPPAFFVAIPQIKKQIEKKIEIKPKTWYGITYGYDIIIDNIEFWA